MSDVLMKNILRQKAVYWAPVGVGPDGQVGRYNPNPLEIDCRWEDRQVEFSDKDGNKTISKALVYVDRDLVLLGLLWLGKLSDKPILTKPFENPGTYEIRGFDKTPDSKAKKFLRIAYL